MGARNSELSMRALVLLAGLFGIGAAQAADLSVAPQGSGSYTLAQPAPPVIVYDFEPGVVIRAYWLPPWGHRHYFPATGRMPVYGRREYLAPNGPLEPAETYYRSWSNSPMPHDRVPLLAPPLK
jgi:hypothetical protein